MTKCPQGVAGPVLEKSPVFGASLAKLDHLTVTPKYFTFSLRNQFVSQCYELRNFSFSDF